jgi:hypothetical protein
VEEHEGLQAMAGRKDEERKAAQREAAADISQELESRAAAILTGRAQSVAQCSLPDATRETEVKLQRSSSRFLFLSSSSSRASHPARATTAPHHPSPYTFLLNSSPHRSS